MSAEAIVSANPLRLKITAHRSTSENQREGRLTFDGWHPHRPWRRYGFSVLLVALGTLVGLLIGRSIEPTNLVMLYLMTVVIAAIYLGRGPSVLAAALGVLAFDFFFVPPHLTLVVSDTQYLLTFAGLLIVGLVIATLTARARDQADAARRREIHALALYEFSRALGAAFTLEDILQSVVIHVGKTFGCQVVVLLPEKGTLGPRALTPGLVLDKDESAIAGWCFKQGDPVGHGTRTPSSTAMLCMPLKTAHGILGVLGIKSLDARLALTAEQHRVLESFASQAALAIERAQFAEQAQQAQLLQEAEKLQSALLNSISHDLRTPLVLITGTLSSLSEDAARFDDSTRSMIESACEGAQRLNHLVGNLLEMTRIEAGAIRMHVELCDVQDVIGSALDRLREQVQNRQIRVDIPSTLPMLPMDFVLIVQVLVNLIENACKYSPADAPIDLWVSCSDSSLKLQIADRGIGIPSSDLPRVFDKFYRVQRANNVPGTGLGLAICKGIVEAHRGKIRAERREGGGTIFTVELPLDSAEETR